MKLQNGEQLLNGEEDNTPYVRSLDEVWEMYGQWVDGRTHFDRCLLREDTSKLPGDQFKHPFEVQRALLGAIGFAAEAGEVLDEHKKLLFHGSDYKIKRAKIVEELGDAMWYLRPIMKAHGITLEEVLAGNVDKLVTKDGVNSEKFGDRAKNGG